MSEPTEPSSSSESGQLAPRQCGSATKAAGTTAMVTAIFAAIALINEPTWPVTVGVAAISAAVAVVCVAMLKRR